jgi:hypothetical protein
MAVVGKQLAVLLAALVALAVVAQKMVGQWVVLETPHQHLHLKEIMVAQRQPVAQKVALAVVVQILLA